MTKESVLELMFQTKIIPLFYEGDAKIACQLLDVCYSGGARVIEFTNRGDNAEEVFTAMLAYCKENYPLLALGVGSISSGDQANRFLDLGAHFLVSPFMDEDVVTVCKQRDVLWTGGCATLTEMHKAHKLGVPLMKAFPGNILGPAFIAAAKAPCPWLKIMPTGGVKPEKDNLEAWFQSGASCVGMGSKLFVKKEDGSFDYDKIEALLKFSIQTADAV